MTGSELLTRLEAAGCQVTLAGTQIKVSGALTDELRAAVREHKPELLRLLKQGTFSEMFQKCCSAFDKQLSGRDGFAQWLAGQPDLAAQIETGEQELDKLRADASTTEAIFREALTNFYRLVVSAIRIFLQQQPGPAASPARRNIKGGAKR